MTNAQQLDLKALLKIYKSNSVSEAYNNLLSLKGFRGNVKVDSLTNDSLIIGVVSKDSMIAQRFKGKIKIELTTNNREIFQAIKGQAIENLYYSNDYARSGSGIGRHHYVYSTKPDMKIGDLWFVLTECRRLNGKGTFYEIELTTYNED